MILKRFLAFVVICSCILFTAHMALAAVSAEEANKLKGELTPLGAEREGNKEGTIPAWTGGYTTVPAGYVSGHVRPDPFATEKPLFSISAKNAEKYAANLSEGTMRLLKRYPNYRLDIYPTHRTAAAPQYVYDNTFKNATRAKTKDNGLSIEGAYGGVPFPIPKTGREAMWNHLLSFKGESIEFGMQSWLISADGKKALAGETGPGFFQFDYYKKNGSPATFNGAYWYNMGVLTAPPYQVGAALLAKDYVDHDRQAWQYMVGQRRVRRAPSMAYDTPDFVASGFNNFDESFMFNGRMDRYDFKILGKKELYIPYNCNRFYHGKIDQVLTKTGVNPDWVRWERHRVWVVEAKLAPAKRHSVPHRIFYLDEDTWNIIIADNWDANGQMWRISLAIPVIVMETPAVVAISTLGWDLLKGTCIAGTLFNSHPTVQWKAVTPKPESFFTPDNLAVMSSR